MNFSREQIIQEIRRTAAANGGIPLGVRRFELETGIKPYRWQKHFAKFGDALIAAGFMPNRLTEPYADVLLLEKIARLALKLGHIPTRGDLQVERTRDTSFPDRKVFERLGTKAEQLEKLRAYCHVIPDYEQVVDLCSLMPVVVSKPKADEPTPEREDGFVYLLRSGRHFKLGRTNALGRRERELAIQLPEKAGLVHSIRTDDPVGIEGYWHRRFGDRRRNGEWFELTPTEVQAFKRRKFM